jgi:hypothetical protein
LAQCHLRFERNCKRFSGVKGETSLLSAGAGIKGDPYQGVFSSAGLSGNFSRAGSIWGFGEIGGIILSIDWGQKPKIFQHKTARPFGGLAIGRGAKILAGCQGEWLPVPSVLWGSRPRTGGSISELGG